MNNNININDKHSIINTFNKLTNKYKCPYCDKEYDTWKSMLEHQAVHFRKKEIDINNSTLYQCTHNNQYQCDLCDKSFYTMRALQAHKQMYKEKQYKQCPYCKKLFTLSHIHIHIKAELKKYNNLII